MGTSIFIKQYKLLLFIYLKTVVARKLMNRTKNQITYVVPIYDD